MRYGRVYPYYHGQQLSDGVKEIVWSGGKLPDDFYDEFVFAGFLASDLPGGPLYFPVTQECEKVKRAGLKSRRRVRTPHALKSPAPAVVILAQHAGHGSSGGAAPAAAGICLQGRLDHGRSAVGACNAGRCTGRRRLYEDHQQRQGGLIVWSVGSVPFAEPFRGARKWRWMSGVMKMRGVKRYRDQAG